MQATSAPPRRRVHVDMTQCEQTLQVARERRLLDVELVPDLDRGDGVARSELREQRVLARRNAQRTHGVVVDARHDARQLAHACRNAGTRSHLGNIGDAGALRRLSLKRVCHDVHVGPRLAAVCGDTTPLA